MKTCTKCHETKPETEFRRDAQKRDGLRSSCGTCCVIAGAAHYAANAAKGRAYAAEYRGKNPEKVKAARAAWRDDNQDERKAYNAEYYADNSEKCKAAVAKWRAENHDACRIYDHNYSARKRENGGQLSKGLAEKLFKLQRGKCACCRTPLGDKYHRDHRMPLALGGANDDLNMQLLCPTCNLQKSAKHPVDFMQQRGFLI